MTHNQALGEALTQLGYTPNQGRDSYLTVELEPDKLVPLIEKLRHNKVIYLDTLLCITGTDGGAESGVMHLHYHLKGMLTQSYLHLHLALPRATPEVPTLCNQFAAANWLERETYDLLGVHFINHPDLRRILLPADWPGHPLRKGEAEVQAGQYAKQLATPAATQPVQAPGL